MAAAFGVAPHVGRPSESGHPGGRCRAAVAVFVDLQGAAYEHVHGIMACHLAEGPVGPHGTVGAEKEYVAPRLAVPLHAQLAAEAVDGIYPAGFDSGDEGGMRVQGPLRANLPLKAQLLCIGRQDQFDGGGVKADAVVEALDAVFLVDAFDGHHCHEYLGIGDVGRVPGEERFEKEGFG